MARQRISLVSDEVKEQAVLEAKIRSGEINPETFQTLSPNQQKQVTNLLFKMASERVEPNIGASVLEFVLFSFMRIMMKRVNHMGLTQDEVEIEESLLKILKMHEITNEDVAKKDWLFDYMQYAEYNAEKILNERKKHIERKKQVTGQA